MQNPRPPHKSRPCCRASCAACRCERRRRTSTRRRRRRSCPSGRQPARRRATTATARPAASGRARRRRGRAPGCCCAGRAPPARRCHGSAPPRARTCCPAPAAAEAGRNQCPWDSWGQRPGFGRAQHASPFLLPRLPQARGKAARSPRPAPRSTRPWPCRAHLPVVARALQLQMALALHHLHRATRRQPQAPSQRTLRRRRRCPAACKGRRTFKFCGALKICFQTCARSRHSPTPARPPGPPTPSAHLAELRKGAAELAGGGAPVAVAALHVVVDLAGRARSGARRMHQPLL